MVLQSTRWLALGYFTYFFSYGIFLPFWSVWLKGIGLTPETIGLLLGAGLVARFLGSTADTSLCCRLLGGGARSVADAGDDWL